MSARDRFLKAQVGRERATVSHPSIGELKIEVREATVNQQMDVLRRTRKPDGSIDETLSNVEIIMLTVYDPDTDAPMFDNADRDWLLNECPARLYGQLLTLANRAAGMLVEDEVVADLDETPSSVTSTS